jgi:hypothetical protein
MFQSCATWKQQHSKTDDRLSDLPYQFWSIIESSIWRLDHPHLCDLNSRTWVLNPYSFCGFQVPVGIPTTLQVSIASRLRPGTHVPPAQHPNPP